METKKSLSIKIGATIKAMRLEKGLLQADVARHLGMTAANMVTYENGKIHITAGRIYQIAKALRVHPGDIYDRAFGTSRKRQAQESPHFDADTIRIMKNIQKLPPAQQEALDFFIEDLVKAVSED